VSRPYLFPEGRADIVVTQTLGCMVTDTKKPADPGNKPLVRSAATASVAYTYVANYASTKKHALNVSDIDFLLSDSDVAISVTEDGRLSTINSNNTGEASAIVKSKRATGRPYHLRTRPETKPNSYAYRQPTMQWTALHPWSIFNRHGWSIFGRRQHDKPGTGKRVTVLSGCGRDYTAFFPLSRWTISSA
jgi:hypothetical protein